MKKNNNGFSLVELIIVIAIMAVLVGVLAPQFIKYVEQSRRSRDISTAQEIREAVLADIADNQVRTDMQTLITQTATSVSSLVTAEANRAGSVEGALRSDLDGLGDSLNSVATLLNKITDWDGTGTYQGIGNGAMDIMHQELHNLIAQFNGLIVTLTNKGILP